MAIPIQRRPFTSFVLAPVFFAVACASTPSHTTEGESAPKREQSAPPSGANLAVESARGQEASDLKEIQALYSGGAYEAAILKMKAFEAAYPKSAQLPSVLNLHGLAHLLAKRPQEAVITFKKALESREGSSTESAWRNYVRYNLAAAQFDAGALDDSKKTLAEIDAHSLDRDNKVKFFFLRGRILDKQGLTSEAVRDFVSAGSLLETSKARGTISNHLIASLKKVSDLGELETLYRGGEESPMADLILFRLIEQEMTQGRNEPAGTHIRTLMTKFPNSVRYADASELLQSIESRVAVEPRTIGVLVPLKGKFARYGQKTLQGIELAFRIFNTSEPDSKVTLAIEDSGEDADQTVAALNRLYFKHKVMAVIGPLLSKGIDQVTSRAQELGLPLVSLAQQPGTPSDYVFQSALTVRNQASEIARYAIQKLGLRKFAILYPRDRFGEEYSQEFWNAVQAQGGQITGIESYTPGETDFRQSVDKLYGLYYTEARHRELEVLAKERDVNKIKKRNRRTEQYFSLKPIADYDAVFIPDEAKVAGQALPTFTYRDVDQIKFLGISTWNSPEFGTRAQKSAESAFFVDGFFAQSENPTVRKFVDRYRATYGQEPDARDALAYDAASVLDKALEGDGSQSRSDLARKLRNLSGFAGVTGKIEYKDGQFTRDLKVLRVTGGQITEVR